MPLRGAANKQVSAAGRSTPSLKTSTSIGARQVMSTLYTDRCIMMHYAMEPKAFLSAQKTLLQTDNFL